MAAIVAVVFILGGIASAIVVRKVVGKLLSLGVCALIALLFWSQRANIKACAAGSCCQIGSLAAICKCARGKKGSHAQGGYQKTCVHRHLLITSTEL